MKNRDLVKQLRGLAKAEDVSFEKKREGGSHTIYEINGTLLSIPRHREIAELLARQILKDAEKAVNEG